jgi:PDZ domain-containing protein
MPVENCMDLPAAVPSGMFVAPVQSLEEAIEAIETTADGGTPAGVERCE